ncbi:MAG: FecR domain-containing protein [Verrucomicrobiales bacterium]|nr:FecR domain-containing protein [Verrucomicrobiales bacterium]
MKNLRSHFFCIMAAIGLLPFSILFAEPESGKVTVAVGDVQVIAKTGDAPVAVKAGDKVVIGSTVKTGAGARAVVVITARSAIRIAENSEVLVEKVDETVKPAKVTVDLKEGSLAALLKPNAAGELDFQVRTPSGVAAARGTFFSVAVKDGKGFAQVKEGKVDIIPAATEKKEN